MALVIKKTPAKSTAFSLAVAAMTPAQVKAAEKYCDKNDKLDRVVALVSKGDVMERAKQMVDAISTANKDQDDLMSRIMNFLYEKFSLYANSDEPKERKKMHNINRFVNNAAVEFDLSQDEKDTLAGYMPDYLERFAHQWNEENVEDTSKVECHLCFEKADGRVFQCEYEDCNIWECIACNGNESRGYGAPSTKKHHNPDFEDKFGCSKPFDFAGSVKEGWLHLCEDDKCHFRTTFNTHADMMPPPFASEANKPILRQMKQEAIDSAVAVILQKDFERKRKNIGDDHAKNKQTCRKYILDDSDDENQNLAITNGEVGIAKEHVPDEKVLSTMKVRDPWSVEKWHEHITTAEKPHLVLGMHPEETDPKFVKGFFKLFYLKWHDDKLQKGLTQAQLEMVHKMLDVFKNAKEAFVKQIEESNAKYMRDNKKEDDNELAGQFDPESDDDY